MNPRHTAKSNQPTPRLESLRSFRVLGSALLAVLICLSVSTGSSFGDDTELLRQNNANPFLFILFDSSRSMAMSIDNKWLPAGADDPRSRMYIAKEIFYEELLNLDNVQYGFATFNQDEVQVVSKHYLYYFKDTDANKAAIAAMPSQLGGYPAVEPNNQISTEDPDVTAGDTEAIDGDIQTLGRTFSAGPVGSHTVPDGTCDDPLSLSTDREAINRYPKFGELGTTSVDLWVTGQGNKVFRLRWQRPTLATWALGDEEITIEMNVVEREGGCADPLGLSTTHTLELALWKPFLWVDDTSGATHSPKIKGCGAEDEPEISGGFWDLSPRDVVEAKDVVAADESCEYDKPFSGQGWEGNYDTGSPFTSNASYETTTLNGTGPWDTYCNGVLDANCVNYKFTTDYATSPNRREIDSGDMLPWHWTSRNHDEMLARLNPNHGTGDDPDFGVANYFDDTASVLTGSLPLADSTRKPILAVGNSPLGAACLDFRCWYTGEDGSKCNRSGDFEPSYNQGFQKVLQDNNPSLWACRKPFMIAVSDLYHNCTANSDVANIAGFNSETSDSGFNNGVSSWLLNLGTGNCNGFTNAGKGRTIDVTSKEQLREVLKEIIGEIKESARAFSAAAVPTVQADVEDKIYFTQFTPQDDNGIWPGEVLAFRKPLPVVEVLIDSELRLVPDRTKKVWDAGIEMLAQSPDYNSLTGPYYTRELLQIGDGDDERRAYYMVEPGVWNYFGPIEGSRSSDDGSITYTANQLRNDLWQDVWKYSYPQRLDMESLDDIKANADWNKALKGAHAIMHHVLTEKQEFNASDVFVRNYILGDIFHSNPKVLSGPSNPFFRSDPETFPGYEDFSFRHQRRRKMLFVGANDGFMHVFDIGRWEGSYDSGSFNNGSGREILAYAPREMLPKLKKLQESPTTHQWFVDGTPQLADVMIDVNGDGYKEWRTLAVFGMRRGGSSLVALDVTQPDPVAVEERNIGGTSVEVGFLPVTTGIVPSCFDAADNLGSPVDETVPEDNFPLDGKCDFVTFGTPLWELTDLTDDDGNDDFDIGQTWSDPEIGPVRVKINGKSELRWVAIFGGGLDPAWETGGTSGNWLYMADIETGKIIYKRQLGSGSAASPPAAVDTSQDGVLDRVYIGTTEGLLYRVDLSTEAVIDTNPANCTLDAFDGMCITDPLWEPEVFLDTATTETETDGTEVTQRRPFFFRPAVFYVGQLGGFGVATGTGNRDNLWSSGPLGGNRFYTFADEFCNNDGTSGGLCQPTGELPLTEATMTNVTNGGSTCSDDVLTDIEARETGERGWFVELGVLPVENSSDLFDPADELMLTSPSNISGLTIFSTFVPETERTSSGGEPQCSRSGLSRSYLYFTASGCEAAPPVVSNDPVSEPFLVAAQTQNEACDPAVETCESTGADPCAGTAEELSETLKETLFPSTCRFSPTFKFNLLTNLSDTGLECIVQIPVCIQQRNWKEF